MEIKKLYKQTRLFKEGDSVRVLPGITCWVTAEEIGGFEGRIKIVTEDEYNSSYEVELDSISLKQLSPEYFPLCIDFRYLDISNKELEPAEPRDTPEDVLNMQNLLFDAYDCHHLKDEDDNGIQTECKYQSGDDGDNPGAPGDLNNVACKDCKRHTCEPMRDFFIDMKIMIFDHFDYCGQDGQYYRIEMLRTEVEKLFGNYTLEDLKPDKKIYSKRYSLN